MSNEMEHLTYDELEMLKQYYTVQPSPVTFATLPPLSTPIPLSHPLASLLSTQIPLSCPSASPLSIQIPLSCPLARGTCTPSSMVSPLTPSTGLPMERPAQHHTIKWQQSILKSGTKESSAENVYGSAELETPVDVALDDMTRMHEGFAEPSCICDTFMLQLLGVISMMAKQIKELKAGGDT